MKNLSKKWLIGIIVVAVGLLAVGVPVLAATKNSAPVNPSNVALCNPSGLDSLTITRLAGILSVTPADLTAQLQTGKTLAAIAGEKNVPTSTLVDAIVAPYADQIALRVKYGYITQAQAQALLDTARQNAGALLSENLSNYGGYTGGWGMMGSGMMGGFWNTTSTSPSNSTTIPAQPPTGIRGGMGSMMGGW